MVDNFDKIKSLFDRGLLTFDKDSFYIINVTIRNKEVDLFHDDVIKVYHISSWKDLMEIKDVLIYLSENLHARIYFNPNKKNYKKVALDTLVKVSDLLAKNQFKQLKKVYSSIAGSSKSINKNDQTWVIDIDYEDISEKRREYLENRDYIKPYIIDKIPTKNGYHILVHKIDSLTFEKEFPEVHLHKNAFTLLYSF